jgi:hypothetical protein
LWPGKSRRASKGRSRRIRLEATAEEESELLEAIAGVERGETARAEDLLERLRR